MGTRLYVNGNEELIAGVPTGTAARLDAFKATQPPVGSRSEAEDKWYETLFADEALNRLHSFRLFGFSRLSHDAYRYVESLGLDPVCGSINDPKQVKEMLALQGVSIPGNAGVTEVSWS
jgi:hypothetical protein